MTRSCFIAAAAIGALVLAAVGTAAPVRSAAVVLGSKTSFAPNGSGWGTSHPAQVFNGGDPTGHAWRLRWTGWGTAVTSATGFTYLAPDHGRTWRKGRLQLRASRISRCSTSGTRAYTRLQIRVAELHGGRFSDWQLWNMRPNLCHP